MNDLLSLKNVCYSYNTEKTETNAVKDLSFTVREGEFVAMIDPSGCGKTTVLSLIAGLLSPTSGKILLNGKEVNGNNKNIGYMLQRDELFAWRSIEKNVFLPLEIKKINNEENRNYAINLLDKYGLKDFKKSYPHQLSGGMRQRVALIRTLVSKPDLLLLDEPFSALDYQTRLDVCNDVYSVIKQERKTALLVTHDISEALSMADRILVLSKRPAKILHVHEYDVDESISPLKRRENKDFGKRFDTLWRELENEREQRI